MLFLDTIEDLAGGEQNQARRQIIEEPVRALYRDLPSILVVMFGATGLCGRTPIPNGPSAKTSTSIF